MAELYGVPPEQVLPTRGATHALELVLRAAKRAGAETASGSMAHLERLADIYGLRIVDSGGDVRMIASPLFEWAVEEATEGHPRFVVLDESDLELTEDSSDTDRIGHIPNLVVLRSLSLAYGLAGARCGAAVAAADTLAMLADVMEPHALPASTVRLAEAVLSPSRALAVQERSRLIHDERERVWAALRGAPGLRLAGPSDAVSIVLEPNDFDAAISAFARFGVDFSSAAGRFLQVAIGPPDSNDRLLAAFGVAPPEQPRRRGEAVRDTNETRIVATVDLDRAGETRVHTGLGFFDHMLEQIAAHGGFSLTLACEGDLHIDAHHTVEDCTLALGAALKQALGDRAGIGRYGFTTPMDEAEASVSLDLSGRPFSVFEGAFTAERIGEYPTALTAHVFRSLADSLGAAIHVRVTGEDDHHKTEVCFKALGRALRQAVRIEGGGVPSTKGVL